MAIVQFGEWVLDVDIEKTKEYYNHYPIENNQIYRNFIEYCKVMPEEEQNFFDLLGINPKCCKPETIGMRKRKKNLPLWMYYYVAAKYVSYPDENLITVEELIDKEFIDDRYETRIYLGIFHFTFQNSNYEIYNIPKDITDEFVCLEAFVEELPWLLNEKCESIMFEMPKKWQIFKRFMLKMDNIKFRNAENKEVCNTLNKLFDNNDIKYKKLSKKETLKLIKKWILSFNKISLKEAKKIYAFGNRKYCNYLWHLFSYDYIKYIDGNEATLKYDIKRKENGLAYVLLNNQKVAYKIDNIKHLSVDKIYDFIDIIIFGQDFSWTFCYTHEGDCGPYYYNVTSETCNI